MPQPHSKPVGNRRRSQEKEPGKGTKTAGKQGSNRIGSGQWGGDGTGRGTRTAERGHGGSPSQKSAQSAGTAPRPHSKPAGNGKRDRKRSWEKEPGKGTRKSGKCRSRRATVGREQGIPKILLGTAGTAPCPHSKLEGNGKRIREKVLEAQEKREASEQDPALTRG